MSRAGSKVVTRAQARPFTGRAFILRKNCMSREILFSRASQEVMETVQPNGAQGAAGSGEEHSLAQLHSVHAQRNTVHGDFTHCA